MRKMKGRIVEIEKCQNRVAYIQQGVKRSDQYKYRNYPGGNGTYIIGGEYLGTELNVKIFIYDIHHSITFEVYNKILTLAGKKKISSKLFKTIKSHESDKVDVYTNDGMNFRFDERVLLRVPNKT